MGEEALAEVRGRIAGPTCQEPGTPSSRIFSREARISPSASAGERSARTTALW
ncbi:MAG TPA: hypothetical protein VGR18_13440 [Rubrobacter sp.]|nr:hypothetical protein [Rubrobacter sp.]